MSKKIVTGLLLCFFSSLFSVTSYAASNPIGYNKVCLQASKIIIKKDGKTIRKRKLTGTGLPIGKKIYIVSITQSKSGQIITTGNQTADAELAPFGAKYVAGVMQYLEGSPTMTTTDGNIQVVVGGVPSYAPARHTSAKFFAVFPVDTGTSVNSNASGTAGGLQQGQFELEELFTPSAVKNCASLQWDPEGKVFDANTLEPMDTIEITILDNTKKTLSQDGVRNPDATDELGYYSFYVEEGDYYLTVKPPKTYTMITNENQVHPNYGMVYSDLYKKDDIIIERIDTEKEKQQGYPDVEHRDIPLYSATERYVRKLGVLSNTEIVLGDSTEYSGQTTHPLTKITIKQAGQIIASGNADKNGAYSIPIQSSLINNEIPVDTTFTKVDLTAGPTAWWKRIVKSVFAEEESVTIRTQPILPTIAGYAYTSKGQVIPYAQVNVRLTHSNVIAVQVTADDEGYFSVPQEAVPSFSYYLEFIEPVSGLTVRKETSEFAVNNSSAQGSKKSVKIEDQNKTPVVTTTPIPTQKDSSINKQYFGYVIGLLIFIIMGVSGAYMYLRRRKTDSSF